MRCFDDVSFSVSPVTHHHFSHHREELNFSFCFFCMFVCLILANHLVSCYKDRQKNLLFGLENEIEATLAVFFSWWSLILMLSSWPKKNDPSETTKGWKFRTREASWEGTVHGKEIICGPC